jgi:hypothetical protein
MHFSWCLCIFLFILGIVPGVIYVIIYLIAGPDKPTGPKININVVNATQTQGGYPQQGYSQAQPPSGGNFCKNCGAQNAPGTRFCVGCGKQM